MRTPRATRGAAALAVVLTVSAFLTANCRARPPVPFDIVHAVGDDVVVVGASPAERAARVARLPRCAALGTAPADWPTAQLRPLAGTLRLPPGYIDRPDEVPTTAEQTWRGSGRGDVTLQLDEDADRSTGFMIGPGEPRPIPTPVNEGTCAAAFAGRLSAVRRLYWVRAAAPGETTFVATTDVPIEGNVQLGAGVVSGTRAGRDSLLAALATLRFDVR